MSHQPHPDQRPVAVGCAVMTVSDTRTPETDRSGQLIQQQLSEAQHPIVEYRLVKDEPEAIRAVLLEWCRRPELHAVIVNGGTGIAPRDTTYEAIESLLHPVLPGFGEVFRWLSFEEIGSRAIATRAIAGVCQGTLIFSLPGSSNAVRLGMERLILPELVHLVTQLHPDWLHHSSPSAPPSL